MPTFTLKVSTSEAQSIRRAAQARRMTLFAYVRHRTLEALRHASKKKQTDKIKPGRAVVATPPITPEMLEAVLYEQAWKTETRCRIAEMESGAVKGISGNEVMAELRGIVGL